MKSKLEIHSQITIRKYWLGYKYRKVLKLLKE